jgi:uncharacterized protein
MNEVAPHPLKDTTLSSAWAWLANMTGVAVTSMAVVALHVVDDSFLHPEPGTSALDHLAGGLISVALLGAAAYAYMRGRAGVKATIALVVGILALVIGATSALHETITVGPSGDDFTGLLVLPAGLVLIGIGIVTLWRSRKLDDGRRRRYIRRTLIAVAAVVTAVWVVFPVGLGYGTTHMMRQSVPEAKLGAAYEDVSFKTSDGLELQGWYVPSKNRAAVIAFPGRSGPRAHARLLARHGFGVLLFDRRGEGKSEGDSNAFGWGGHKDILGAIEFLKGRPDVDPGRIGGIGFSVGGELMLEAAAATEELSAVVSEGAGTRSLSGAMEEVHGFEKWISMPTFVVQEASVAVFSNTAPPPNLTDLAPKIEQPLFVIWAPNGGNVEHMSREYYKLARGPKQIWAMPTAKHIGGIYDQPKEYERRVVGFFDDALLGQS